MKTKTARSQKKPLKNTVFKRILVPTDFSTASISAVDQARELARRTRGTLILVHVIIPAGAPDLVYGSLLWNPAEIMNAAREALKNWKVEAGLSRTRNIEEQVRTGVPHHEIVTAATETKADLIVIPTHGRTGLGHYLMGGTAERVIRHAPCPVLVVRAG